MTGTVYVIDYKAMGLSTRPRRLHRTDCSHPAVGTSFRPANAQELRELPECYHCAAADLKETA